MAFILNKSKTVKSKKLKTGLGKIIAIGYLSYSGFGKILILYMQTVSFIYEKKYYLNN